MVNLLAIDWYFDPVLFTIGGVEVRYYGLTWALMILVSAKLFDYFCRHEGLSPKISESAFAYGVLGTIIGSRVGHCLFYEPEHYLRYPWEIVTGIRDGGMASHGAAIGLLVGMWLFSRRNKLPYVWGMDRIMIAVGIGAALIRFGNLFNSEIFGHETDLPWGFRFHNSRLWLNEVAPMASHPTQIYEALCYLASFALLWVMYSRYDMGRRRPGLIFGVGVVSMFTARFFVEFVKFEQVAFEKGMNLLMGQWLSIPFIAMGIYLIYRAMSQPEQSVNRIKPKK